MRDRVGQPRRRADRGLGLEVERDRADRESSTDRRPPRIVPVPCSPRAQRRAWALASVGTSATAASSRSVSLGVRPHAPSSPPAAATSAMRSRTSGTVSSPSQPGPKTTPTQGSSRKREAASRIASQSGLARPASSPWPSTSPPTSTSAIASQPRRAAASVSPCAAPAGPPCGSISATGSPRKRAMCDSAKWNGPGPRVSGPASAAYSPIRSAPSSSSRRRGPGRASITRRSQLTPPTCASSPASRARSAVASAPTTSPPPPMPTDSTDREAAKKG